MRAISSILLWSVIAAAFIGPGTVTTAASAGASHGLSLLWALVFSTVACLTLQEASARLTAVSGHTLGQALRERYSGRWQGVLVLWFISGAILIGCAAYEAGNILGGVAGAVLASGMPPRFLAVASAALAAALLWFKAPQTVARMLSALVAVMGVAFLVTAWRIAPDLGDLVRASLLPTLPRGSGVLALGLIGTTVVPYNLFLGSGLAGGEQLRAVRLGLTISIVLGGVISMAVLVAGTTVAGTFSFANLAAVLARRLGDWAGTLFAVGLLGAGLSSAVTAPLAAAITARDLFGNDRFDRRWSPTAWRYRSVWLAVLLSGLGFGLSDVKPIPAIVLAQAMNGLLLPWVAILLFQMVNDRRLMRNQRNGAVTNVIMGTVVLITLLLGVSALAHAIARALGTAPPEPRHLLLISALLATVAGALLLRSAIRRRR